MVYNQTDMLYGVENGVDPLQVFFGIPNAWTGDAWIDIVLMLLFTIPFIMTIAVKRDIRMAVLSGSALTWLSSFGLFVVPEAKVTQDHLLMTTVLLGTAVVVNYFSQRR